jgi:CheY-like chemotaxis protein
MSRKDTKILIIEDDADTQFITSMVLRNAGYIVHGTATRNEALQTVPVFLPALIVTDFCMDGLGFGEFIFEMRKTVPGIHFVLLSALAAEVSRQYHIKYWLQKPFDIADLESTVAACLRGGSSSLMRAVKKTQ